MRHHLSVILFLGSDYDSLPFDVSLSLSAAISRSVAVPPVVNPKATATYRTVEPSVNAALEDGVEDGELDMLLYTLLDDGSTAWFNQHSSLPRCAAATIMSQVKELQRSAVLAYNDRKYNVALAQFRDVADTLQLLYPHSHPECVKVRKSIEMVRRKVAASQEVH